VTSSAPKSYLKMRRTMDVESFSRLPGFITRSLQTGDALEKIVESDARLHPRQSRPKTEVNTMAKGNVRIGIARIDRAHGAAPFGPREVAILKLLHDEVGPLVGVRLATEEHLCRDGLSKRLRETLSVLLEGLSEKQVAGKFDLSIKTVHEYVGMLYKHFQVSSRAELLAYFIRRQPVPRQRKLRF
jgi:DNA-binding CsgD family transcriptional regulator